MARPKAGTPKTANDLFSMLAEKTAISAERPNMYGYKPHAKQVRFHSATEKLRLYIGGNRSGKTTGGVLEDLKWVTRRHEYRVLPNRPIKGRVIGVDFNYGVEKILLPEFARWLPPSDLINGSWEDSYSRQFRTLTLDNGSFIEFMSYDQDLDKFAGTSRDFIHYDEEPPENVFEENQARLIDTGGSSWLTMTPIDGMTWIYDAIYLPGSKGLNPGIAVIEIAMWENPYLGEAEVQQYLGGLTDEQRKTRGEGKFVQLGGMIYKTFSEANQLDFQKFTEALSSTFEIHESMDHGFNNASAWLWHAVAKNGRVITFKEHVQEEWTVDQHAAKVIEIRKEIAKLGCGVVESTTGDPSIAQRNAITGTSIQEEYAKYGVFISLGNNRVEDGLIRVNKYIKTATDGIPMWLVTKNCPTLIHQMARLRWKTYTSKKTASQHNKNEVQHKKDDHAPDALRYFIMSRPDLFVGTPPVGKNVMIPEGGYSVPASDYDEDLRSRILDQIEHRPEPLTREYTWDVEEYMGGEW